MAPPSTPLLAGPKQLAHVRKQPRGVKGGVHGRLRCVAAHKTSFEAKRLSQARRRLSRPWIQVVINQSTQYPAMAPGHALRRIFAVSTHQLLQVGQPHAVERGKRRFGGGAPARRAVLCSLAAVLLSCHGCYRS